MCDLNKTLLCYAGLDKEALWRHARQFFAEDQGRFATFLPLFPTELAQSMPYVGVREGGPFAAPNGFSIDPSEYHRRLYAELPELYAGDNLRRCTDYEGRFHGRGVVTVDRCWVSFFPQYEPFLGERLCLFLPGNGGQAVAVPESVYPRGGGLLRSAELDMRVTARGERYALWVRQRVESGTPFDAAVFQREYLQETGLNPVTISQNELAHVMQDFSIVRSLGDERECESLYTQHSKRSELLPQYAPFQIACDLFELTPVTRSTARLLQLRFSGDDWIGDLWLPYQDVCEYVDRREGVLDVRALCEGFQIPPRYDPSVGGGRYPDTARVVVVRDRLLKPMVASVMNNPAYGGGMSPLGTLNKLVFLPDSAELLRLRKLQEEESPLRCQNLTVSPQEYARMLRRAALQEKKGRLIDALYRREAALSQLREGSSAYRRAQETLDLRAARAENALAQADGGKWEQLSGYDADLDYLRRLAESRRPVEEEEAPPLAFAPDPLRLMSVESGFAMRGAYARFDWEALALPEEAEETPPEQEPAPENDLLTP